MRRTRVKICGVTSPEDATAAVAAGADAVGMVFAEGSPRRVTPGRAAEIAAALTPFEARVGVFVDAAPEEILEAVAVARLSAVQLHGDEPPGFCDELPVPVVKAFRVDERFSAEAVEPYRGHVSAILLDTYRSGTPGGTGHKFAYDLVGPLPEGIPVLIAGGLDPIDVGDAVHRFEPYGVDVSSGVEEFPGRKDRNMMAAFCTAVRVADAELKAGRLQEERERTVSRERVDPRDRSVSREEGAR